MKIGVLGSGNGGCAVAFDYAKMGYDVFMFDFEQFPTQVNAITKNKGISAEGQLEGFAEIKYAGHDIEKVVSGADIIFAVGPAYSTEPFGEACKPYLKKGQVVIVCPGSCGGGIVFKNAIGLDIKDDSIIIAETHTLPYAVRLRGPAKIHVSHKLTDGLFLAALPSKYTNDVLALTKDVYPYIIPAKNVLQTALQNANPVIHPAISLLNAGLLERTKGDFLFYEEGITSAVGRVMEAVDKERIAIGKKLGVEVVPDPVMGVRQGYMQEAIYGKGYSEGKGFKGSKAPSSLDNRYVHEDVGYGLLFMAELGKSLGVETKIINAIIDIFVVVMDRDYRAEKKRTMQTLGLAKYSLEELEQIL